MKPSSILYFGASIMVSIGVGALSSIGWAFITFGCFMVVAAMVDFLCYP